LFYLADANYNVTAVVAFNDQTETWQVAERYLYDPYGGVTVLNGDTTVDPDGQADPQTFPEWSVDPGPDGQSGTSDDGTTSDVSNTTLYTGRELDPETRLYYYRARYYHPHLGRFLSRDPLGYAAGDENLYRYVLDNPLVLLDPAGLRKSRFPWLWDDTGTVISSIVDRREQVRWRAVQAAYFRSPHDSHCYLYIQWEKEVRWEGLFEAYKEQHRMPAAARRLLQNIRRNVTTYRNQVSTREEAIREIRRAKTSVQFAEDSLTSYGAVITPVGAVYRPAILYTILIGPFFLGVKKLNESQLNNAIAMANAATARANAAAAAVRQDWQTLVSTEWKLERRWILLGRVWRSSEWLSAYEHVTTKTHVPPEKCGSSPCDIRHIDPRKVLVHMGDSPPGDGDAIVLE